MADKETSEVELVMSNSADDEDDVQNCSPTAKVIVAEEAYEKEDECHDFVKQGEDKETCISEKEDKCHDFGEETPISEKEDECHEFVEQGEDEKTPIDGDTDEYAYLKREGFTSEIFKIEIKNLKKKITPYLLKKLVLSKNLTPKKVKVLRLSYEVKAYVAFSCEEDRERALKALNGLEWKGCHLLAKNAAPKADPLQLKKKMDFRDSEEPATKRARLWDNDLDPLEKLKGSVVSLWNVPYEEQLKRKYADMREVIRKLGRLIDRNNPPLLQWFIREKKNNGGLCCPLDPVIESPNREGYRNKCEFTIGRSLDGTERVVGFRYGKYRGGCDSVGEPDLCPNVPSHMLKVVKPEAKLTFLESLFQLVQSHVESSPYDVFDPKTCQGHWRMLTVRTNVRGMALAMVEFHPQDLDEVKLDEVRKSLAEYVAENGRDIITSLYFHINEEKTTATNDLTPYELIMGEEGITEVLSGLEFRISPLAFFQVNTLAAEKLYEQVGKLCSAGPDTTVLDICCGTGTIGLTMAKRVKKVIGIEMVQAAVNDAKQNAANNGVENAEYICAKAEDVLPDFMDRVSWENVVAVVDPPRAGLHIKVVQALRRCERLKKIVYVSCCPTSALSNFIDFCRAKSKRIRGTPFVPIQAVCVDMFPDTPHCELVIVFERYDPDRHLPSQSATSETTYSSQKYQVSEHEKNDFI